jgi:hypothetical protein
MKCAIAGAALILLSLSGSVPAADICRVGSAVEIKWSGHWWPGRVKQSDADGRCFVSYDNYDSSWDAWVTPDVLRAPGSGTQAPVRGSPARSSPAPSPARAATERRPATFIPKRDECRVDERVMTRDGDLGTVTSIGTVGACYVTLDRGGTAASMPSQFHSLSHGQGPVRGMPPLGVYDCNSPEIFIRADVMFSLRSGGDYVHFDGGRGTWGYDEASSVLSMKSGPIAGLSYFRSGETTFSLRQDGAPTNVNCVNNPAKNADRPPW